MDSFQAFSTLVNSVCEASSESGSLLLDIGETSSESKCSFTDVCEASESGSLLLDICEGQVNSDATYITPVIAFLIPDPCCAAPAARHLNP